MLASVLRAAAALLAAALLVPALLGFERYVVTGDSMRGTYARGSLVFDRRVPAGSLRVGDVITYTPPQGGGLVTHRIAARAGKALRTKGDANRLPDPWRFEPAGRTQAKVVFSIPYAGWAFAALSVYLVRLLAIGVPALLVALALLARLWRETACAA